MNDGAAPTDLINDTEFITDLARYGEGVLTEAQVKRKYRRFDDNVWAKLGSDDALVDAIEAERTRRIRSGACVREKAQLLQTKALDVTIHLSGGVEPHSGGVGHVRPAPPAQALPDEGGVASAAACKLPPGRRARGLRRFIRPVVLPQPVG